MLLKSTIQITDAKKTYNNEKLSTLGYRVLRKALTSKRHYGKVVAY
ncbi:MAG: hypothetical protein HN831_03980 [Waddliaceae bacterium]|nr:hypothetical protein [Waddliaceae bacterium]